MRYKMYGLVWMVFAVVCVGNVAAQTKPDVASLSWMSGCWELKKPTSTTYESWGRSTENLMLGTSQTIKGTKSVAFEFLRIAATDKGLTYYAQPSNAKEPTAFASTKVTANEVIFENLQHDFPQRIIYKTDGPDKLNARIEGPMNGQLKGIDFAMTRAKCN